MPMVKSSWPWWAETLSIVGIMLMRTDVEPSPSSGTSDTNRIVCLHGILECLVSQRVVRRTTEGNYQLRHRKDFRLMQKLSDHLHIDPAKPKAKLQAFMDSIKANAAVRIRGSRTRTGTGLHIIKVLMRMIPTMESVSAHQGQDLGLRLCRIHMEVIRQLLHQPKVLAMPIRESCQIAETGN